MANKQVYEIGGVKINTDSQSSAQKLYDRDFAPAAVASKKPTAVSTKSPAVLTSKAADTHMNTVVKPTLDEAEAGILSQQQNLAQQNVLNEQKQTQDSTAALDTATKQSQIDLNKQKVLLAQKQVQSVDGGDTSYAGGTPDTSTASTSPSDTTSGGTAPAAPQTTLGGLQTKLDTENNQLDQATDEYEKASTDFSKSIDRIRSGAIPLSTADQAQVDGLKQQYDALIDQQKLVNTGASGSANVRGYQTGSAEYDNTFQAKVIGPIVTAGISKIADLNTQMASAVAELKTSFQDKKIEDIQTKFDILKDVQEKRQTQIQDMIDSTSAAIKDEQERIQKQEDQRQKDVDEIVKDAAKNGAPADVIAAISNSTDIGGAATAAGEYLQSGEYFDYVRAAHASGVTPVDAATYYARKIYGEGAGKEGSDPFSSGDVPFQATIEGAASLAQSDAARAAAAKQLAGLASSGDYPALLNRLQGLAKNGMTGSTKTDVEQATSQIGFLDHMSSVLKAYEAAGGDIGVLKGTDQDIANKIGKLTTDPKFASIATELKAAYFQYRSNMSGAAFGAAENASYQSIFPSAGKDFELNAAVMDGLKDYYKTNINTQYSDVLGEGYDNLKDYVEQGLTPTGKILLKTEQDAKEKLHTLTGGDPAKQEQVSQFLTENPGASSYDVLQFLGVPVATSNEVSMTGPSNGVVGGYDIKSYATDPNHEKRVAAIFDKTKSLADAGSIQTYIRSVAPNSPVTGAQVIKAAQETGVAPGIILAIMQQDSTFGTAGKAVRTKNPGNVGNTDSGATKAFPDWQQGVLAVANNLAKRKIS